MCRARDHHFQPWISVPEHIIFPNYKKTQTKQKKLADFAVPETIIFKISLISTRSSPPTTGSARTQSVWQRRGFEAVPKIRIFTAQNGSSSFRRFAFSCSNWLKLVPEPPIFKLKTAQARSGAPHFHARQGARSGALAHFSLFRGTYLPKFGVSTPPPPRGDRPVHNVR